MRLPVLIVAASWLVPPAYAQSMWFDLPVPTASLAQIEVTLDEGRALAAQRIIRVLHTIPREGDPSPPVLDFERFLTDLDTFEREALRAGTRGLSLEMAKNSSERDVLKDVLEVMGLRLRERRGVYSVEANQDGDAVTLRKRLDSAGMDTGAIEKELNDGRTVMPVPAVTILPSPLSHETWASVVFRRPIPERALFSAIIRDRPASLLFYGLLSMTPETRAYVATNRELLQHLYQDGAGAVAAFGSSFRLDDTGHVIVPGGSEAVELWESLMDERLEQTDRFARALFDRDAGRLAYFLDAMAHLDAPRQRFALGLWITDRGIRLDRFRALYRAFTDVDPMWSVLTRPFTRPLHDPATLLGLVLVGPQGEPASPSHRRFWDRAFDGVDLPGAGARELKDVAEDGVVDAAWLAEHVLPGLFQERQERLERLSFGQRVFGSVPDAELDDVLVVIRAVGRFPALMRALERMGVRRPATYALVARRARDIEDAGDPEIALPLLAQFQGALVLLERTSRTGSIPGSQIDGLVSSLAHVRPTDRGYDGALAAWVETSLLPAVPPAPRDDDRPLETSLLRALAENGEGGAPFLWEGARYVPDLAATSFHDLVAVRAKQGGNSLDAVLSVAREVAALRQDGLTLDALKPRVVSLKNAGGRLAAARAWPDVPEGVPDVKKIIDRAVRDLSKIGKAKDLSKTPRIAEPLIGLVDYLLGETLVALAYAPHLGDPGDLLGPESDVSHRHNFGLTPKPGAVAVERRAWLRPGRDTAVNAGQAMSGSLFGLDLSLSRKRLRRLVTDTLPSAPRLSSNDGAAFVDVLALLNPRTLRSEDLASIGYAIARGREQVRAATDVASLDALAARVSMGEARRQILGWTAQQEPAHLETLFSPADVFRLGLDERPFEDLDAWGTSFEPQSGCYCLRFPAPGAWDRMAGRPGGGQLGATVPDLTLRVAEHLAALKVPASLVPGVMAMATQEFIDTAQPMYDDDWLGVVGHTRHLSRETVEDFVAALVAAGPVRTVSGQEAPR